MSVGIVNWHDRPVVIVSERERVVAQVTLGELRERLPLALGERAVMVGVDDPRAWICLGDDFPSWEGRA